MLSVNNLDADARTALCSLGQHVPGIFASGNASVVHHETRDIVPAGPRVYHKDFHTAWTDHFCASELAMRNVVSNSGEGDVDYPS